MHFPLHLPLSLTFSGLPYWSHRLVGCVVSDWLGLFGNPTLRSLPIELLLREWRFALWMLATVVLIRFSVRSHKRKLFKLPEVYRPIDPLFTFHSITIPVEISAATILITFWDDNVNAFLSSFSEATQGLICNGHPPVSTSIRLVILLCCASSSVSSTFLVFGGSENVGLPSLLGKK